VLDLLGAGPASFAGLLCGLALAALLHWAFPSLAEAYILYAVLVAGGFLAGLVFDSRARKR
jgi:hypothetical protein